MTTLNIRLGNELHRQLAQEAELADQTRSEIVRRALQDYLAQRQRQRFLDAIARAARARGGPDPVAAAEEALGTDNEALARAERSVVERQSRRPSR